MALHFEGDDPELSQEEIVIKGPIAPVNLTEEIVLTR
jgi:hypothetical protein